MKLAFYYHIPMSTDGNNVFCPSYLGVFLDALAVEVEVLFILGHETSIGNSNDYVLKSKNIMFVSLGKKTAAWHRILFFDRILKNNFKIINCCDAFLIRSPTPLAPFFYKYCSVKIFFLIVGDYLASIKEVQNKNLRYWAVYVLNLYQDRLFRKQIKNADIFVNSPALFETYENISKSITLVKTTTITKSDFFYRSDILISPVLKLLYCGRIDLSKGLVELLEATAMLFHSNIDVQLNIVGWEEDASRPIENGLLLKAKSLNIENKIIFHGKKKIGMPLNKMYREASLFVIPSYQEGFPRVIWEAMANSLPVIATRVGGIPYYLKDNENVILIQPKSSQEIYDAIFHLYENPYLRQKLIKNGFSLVKENTIDVQTKMIVNLMKKLC